MTVSYAQNFEDVILLRALKQVEKGAYIDIGANDPVVDSVSLAFYERGWRGVHVEPMHEYAERLRAARPDEEVIEAAVTNRKGKVTLAEFSGTGLTTAIKEHAERHEKAGLTAKTLSVPGVALLDIFARFDGRDIHWMKIDVEGMEAEVLESWRDHPARPWVLVVESTLPNTPEQKYDEWEELVLARGYEFVYFDGLNRFYVHEDHAELKGAFGPGPNFFDFFSLSEYSPFGGVLHQRASAARAEAERAQSELKIISGWLRDQATGLAEAVAGAIEGVRAEALEGRLLLDAQLGRVDERLVEAYTEKKRLAERLTDREAEIRRLHETLQSQVESFRASAEQARSDALAAIAAGEQALSIERARTAEATAALSSLEAELADAKAAHAQDRAAAEARLDEVRAAHAALKSELTEVEAAYDALAIDIDQARREAAALRYNLANQVAAYESALASARKTAAEAEAAQKAELELSEQHAANLRRDRDAWRAEARELRVQVEALRQSASWRLSAPVRWVGLAGRAVVGGAKWAMRPLVEKALALVRRTPWLKRPILFIANLAPPLRRKIDHFWAVRSQSSIEREQAHLPPIEKDSAGESRSRVEELEVVLHPRAVSILRDLEAARQK